MVQYNEILQEIIVSAKHKWLHMNNSIEVSGKKIRKSLFEKQCNKLEILYYRRTKHLKTCVKNMAIASFLHTIFSVLYPGNKRFLAYYILLHG